MKSYINCLFYAARVVIRITINPDGVVYGIPCRCGKVYVGETGRATQDRIKEHDRDIRLARTETSVVSEHARNTGHKPLWNEVKFIDRDPYYYTRRVKEAIHIRLYPDNINTIKKTQQQESRATADRRGSKSLSEQQVSKCTNQSCCKNN